MRKELYFKFPSVLRKALESKKVEFTEDTFFEYEDVVVYRGITRTNGNNKKISMKDFDSYVELGKKVRGKSIDKDIGYYSCSCFSKIDELKEAMKLPRNNKKIIQGVIKSKNGPNRFKPRNNHYDWWLFDNVDVSNDFETNYMKSSIN